MKRHFSSSSLGARSARWLKCGMAVVAAAATLLAAAGSASAKPVISHDPVLTAVKGEPLGLRATVRDASGRISSVSVFYASSRGMTPFRRDLTTTGADIWYGTIPGHLIGPGSNLFYYVHADNIEGDSTDTEWVTVNVIEPGMSAADMPTVQTVARQSQEAAAAEAATEAATATVSPSKAAAKTPAKTSSRTTSRPAAQTTTAVSPSSPASAPVVVSAPEQSVQDGEESGRSKYLVPVAIGVGAAAIIGGAIAIANHSSGGGGSSSSGSGAESGSSSSDTSGTVSDGNYGGSYSLCFEPSGTDSNAITHCDSGPVNLYVENGSIQIAGLWGSEVLTATLSGNTFTAESAVSARGDFPDAHIIVAGDIGSSTASARVVGYSADTANPGNFTGNISATRR